MYTLGNNTDLFLQTVGMDCKYRMCNLVFHFKINNVVLVGLVYDIYN